VQSIQTTTEKGGVSPKNRTKGLVAVTREDWRQTNEKNTILEPVSTTIRGTGTASLILSITRSTARYMHTTFTVGTLRRGPRLNPSGNWSKDGLTLSRGGGNGCGAVTLPRPAVNEREREGGTLGAKPWLRNGLTAIDKFGPNFPDRFPNLRRAAS